jgi:hypothetical protein
MHTIKNKDLRTPSLSLTRSHEENMCKQETA